MAYRHQRLAEAPALGRLEGRRCMLPRRAEKADSSSNRLCTLRYWGPAVAHTIFSFLLFFDLEGGEKAARSGKQSVVTIWR